MRKWQEKWSSSQLANNKKYKNIRKTVEVWPSSFQKQRRTEVVLTRLRIGHTWLTHKFLLEGAGAPVCADCADALTVEHILVRCSKYSVQRQQYNLTGKSMTQILGDEADVPKLMGFLKAAGLYCQI